MPRPPTPSEVNSKNREFWRQPPPNRSAAAPVAPKPQPQPISIKEVTRVSDIIPYRRTGK